MEMGIFRWRYFLRRWRYREPNQINQRYLDHSPHEEWQLGILGREKIEGFDQEKTTEKEISDDEDDAQDKKEDKKEDDTEIKDENEEKEKKDKKKKTVKEVTTEFEDLNK